MTPKERIFVAIDTPDINKATEMAKALSGEVGGNKFGKELFSAQGPNAIRGAVGGNLFLSTRSFKISSIQQPIQLA
ncbi:hypothetical protein [Kiloniella sp.]|uniref:hypothetical protein n=1 Tax=Kiloniella sp. TaxID=1938587 RepID=UPI003A8E2987